MKLSFGVTAIAILTCAGAAAAQASPSSAPAEAASPAAAPGAVSDAELQSFASATLKLHALTQPTPEQMGAAISGAGLSVDRYNAIAGQMQKDPAFQARVNAALVRAAQAQANTSPQGAPPQGEAQSHGTATAAPSAP